MERRRCVDSLVESSGIRRDSGGSTSAVPFRGREVDLNSIFEKVEAMSQSAQLDEQVRAAGMSETARVPFSLPLGLRALHVRAL